MFENKESFKHKFAKDLLFEWITSVEKKANVEGVWCEFCGLSWNPHNLKAMKELKFHKTDDPNYFTCSKGLLSDSNGYLVEDISTGLNLFDPTFDRGHILFVPDITIFHTGSVQTLIEVVHSNLVTESKLKRIKEFFNGGDVEVYEIQAETILKQIQVPKKLKFKQII